MPIQAAVALYAAMKAGWAFGRDFTFDMISDIADGTSPHAGIARGTSFSSGDASVQNTWQYLYEVVHRSNTVIRNVSAMDIDETVKTRVIGEAKFLRAMAYFRMLNCWGGVPYYDESCIIEEEFATLSNPRRIGRNHPRSHSRRPDGCHLQTSRSLGNIRLRACHERGCLRFAAGRYIFTTGSGARPLPILKKSSTTKRIITAMNCIRITMNCSACTTANAAKR